MRQIRINHGRVVPWTFRFLGTIIVMIVAIQILKNLPEYLAIPSAIVISMGLPILWFSFEMISIDMDKKEIHDGYWIMGFRIGKVDKFGKIEKFFINRVKTSQKVHAMSNQSYTSKNEEYQAFIKTDNGEKYFLTSEPSEEKIEEKVNEIRSKLGL